MRHLKIFQYIESVSRSRSIRQAAEEMNITASALNRQIQKFEEELGSELFERLPRGVRLNAAGKLILQHYRTQLSELQRVQSEVADLVGERQGHVNIACSQALAPYFLPREIGIYRTEHPRITFGVRIRDRAAAEHDLSVFASDLALVLEPVHLANDDVLAVCPQPIHVIMRADNPLGRQSEIRLHQCLEQVCVLPSRDYAIRALLEAAVLDKPYGLVAAVESDSFDFMRHYVLHENAITFQIPIGFTFDKSPELIGRMLSPRDVPVAKLLLGKLKGRSLPAATSSFAQQVARAMTNL